MRKTRDRFTDVRHCLVWKIRYRRDSDLVCKQGNKPNLSLHDTVKSLSSFLIFRIIHLSVTVPLIISYLLTISFSFFSFSSFCRT